MRQAAEELCVTPGAVSQQVRSLESHLGVMLFERSARAIRLTDPGQEFYTAVSRHLRGIAQAADQLKPREQQIAVSVAPDFASRWLMPRLGRFAALNPKVEVRIDASFELVDFERDPFDLGIRTGLEVPAGLHAELLLRQTLRPYCSYEYFARVFRRKSRPAAWSHARLLHETHPFDQWNQWFAVRGSLQPNSEAGLYFSHGLLAILAAINGEGVTLQPPEYVEREIAAGALVAADDLLVQTGIGYYLVWPRRPLRPAAERFKSWLLDLRRADAVNEKVA